MARDTEMLTALAAAPLPKGRHNLSREQVAETQRIRLLLALADALADNGYAKTPVADILSRAGVSRQTFYQLYDNKLDCFLDGLALVGDLLVEELSRHLTADGDPVTAAANAIDAYLQMIARFPAFARLFIVEVHAAGPVAMQQRAALQHRIVDGLCQLLGVSSDTDRFACEIFVAAVPSMAAVPLITGDEAALGVLRPALVNQLERLARQVGDTSAGDERPGGE